MARERKRTIDGIPLEKIIGVINSVGGRVKKTTFGYMAHTNIEDFNCSNTNETLNFKPEEFKKIKKKYPKRFNEDEIQILFKGGCSPEETTSYDVRFSATDILCLFHNNISALEANSYSPRFTPEDIFWLVTGGCPPMEAEKYPQRIENEYSGQNHYSTGITGLGISHLFKDGCTPEIVNQYNPRFDYNEISALYSVGCSSEQADEYALKFGGHDIARLVSFNCSPVIVKKYSSCFSGCDIVDFVSNAIYPEIANQYARFNSNEILEFIKNKIPPELVSRYLERFDGNDILSLIEVNCPPEEAEKYNPFFAGRVIRVLFDQGYTPQDADKFFEAIRLHRIEDFIREGFSFKEAKKMEDVSRIYELGNLVLKGCSLEEFKKYCPRFEKEYISDLIEFGCPPEEADKYNLRFGAWEVANLFKVGCSPEETDKYDPNLDGEQIAMLYITGLRPDIFPKEKQKNLVLLINRIVETMDFELKNLEDAKYYTSLGVGASGIVLINTRDNTVRKYSIGITKEFKLLKKIENYHKGKVNNIITSKGDLIFDTAMSLESISGDSLANILKKQNSLSPNKIIKYTSDIMNGLIEMRQAGVWYHRDIRPANILIEDGHDNAVIIDFGIATTDRKALPKDNRRYGGVNDLVSLGQIVYKMATGEHIFAESKSMERTTHAQKIKDYRDEVYGDKTGELLAKHLKQVDEKIHDETLKTIIKTCLTSKNYHYKKIKKLFDRLSN